VDLAGDGDAVVGHLGRAGDLLEDDVAALRAERALHGLGEWSTPALEQAATLLAEAQFLGHADFSR
jgi:hypothetical protein